MAIRTDYHMHTPLCQHAAGPLEAYVERAIQLGLREIGFSDHNPLPDGRGANVRMKENELDRYVADVLLLKDHYRDDIIVRLGIEMDFVAELGDYSRAQLARYPWDYVIGSVHYLNAACTMGSWSRAPIPEMDRHYARYFACVRDLATSGLCDIIAHFDVAKRTGIAPGPAQADEITRTLQAIKAADVAVEINTSGYRHKELPVAEPYPGEATIREMIALGIPLIVNSDAHHPDHVGTEFPRTEAFLKANGCRELVQFAGRKRTAYSI